MEPTTATLDPSAILPDDVIHNATRFQRFLLERGWGTMQSDGIVELSEGASFVAIILMAMAFAAAFFGLAWIGEKVGDAAGRLFQRGVTRIQAEIERRSSARAATEPLVGETVPA